jgi:hypothetical protein
MPICFACPELLCTQGSPCPEGTRLGEANVHNRRCGSRRETCLRIEAPPTPPPEGRYFTNWTRKKMSLQKF